MKNAPLLLGLILLSAWVGWGFLEGGAAREGLLPAALPPAPSLIETDPIGATPFMAKPEELRSLRKGLAEEPARTDPSYARTGADLIPFQVEGLVLARDGTPMAGVEVYALDRQQLLGFGLDLDRLDAGLAISLLEASGSARSATTDEEGAFSLTCSNAGARILVAMDPKHGQSRSLQVEHNRERVILRYELSRLTVRLDPGERIPSSISVHLRTKAAQDDEDAWATRTLEENWRSSWLVSPGSLHDLKIFPRTEDSGEGYWRDTWAHENQCRVPLHFDVKLAGLRLHHQVHIPSEAVHHEVDLTLPHAATTSRLNLELEAADRSVAWQVRVFDEPVEAATSSPCYESTLLASCFPASLELPSGRYSLRYAPMVSESANGFLGARRSKGPETWVSLNLLGGVAHTEVLNRTEGAEVSFHLEFTSQNPQKFEWLETAYRNSGRTVQHEVILISPSGHENIAKMDFTYGSRGDAHIALNVVPQRRLEVGKWSFFMSNETLGTLSTDFEVLEGKHNHFTLRGELP